MKIRNVIIFGLNKNGSNIVNWLKKNNITILYIVDNKSKMIKTRNMLTDLIISCGFRHKINEINLKNAKFGGINMHKSYLPLNKGANPNFWTIYNQTKAGVTIHEISNKIDSGHIILQKEIKYSINDNSKSLYNSLEKAQLELFIKFWKNPKKYFENKFKQSTKGTTHYKSDFTQMINLNEKNKKNLFKNINLLKATYFPPFDNIFFNSNNKKYRVKILFEEIKTNEKKDRYLKKYKLNEKN